MRFPLIPRAAVRDDRAGFGLHQSRLLILALPLLIACGSSGPTAPPVTLNQVDATDVGGDLAADVNALAADLEYFFLVGEFQRAPLALQGWHGLCQPTVSGDSTSDSKGVALNATFTYSRPSCRFTTPNPSSGIDSETVSWSGTLRQRNFTGGNVSYGVSASAQQYHWYFAFYGSGTFEEIDFDMDGTDSVSYSANGAFRSSNFIIGETLNGNPTYTTQIAANLVFTPLQGRTIQPSLDSVPPGSMLLEPRVPGGAAVYQWTRSVSTPASYTFDITTPSSLVVDSLCTNSPVFKSGTIEATLAHSSTGLTVSYGGCGVTPVVATF
ncbi:MAG TPA: hypothetical protein VMG41_16425 [Gemmatimonadales bacterium]|nr:hypothetical protein [Gemmatimonadales bacterium]